MLVILDPPHILQAAHDPLDTSNITLLPPPSQSSSMTATCVPDTDDSSIVNSNDDSNATISPELILRGWWIPNEDKTVYRGIKDTMSYLYDILEKQHKVPFDVSRVRLCTIYIISHLGIMSAVGFLVLGRLRV